MSTKEDFAGEPRERDAFINFISGLNPREYMDWYIEASPPQKRFADDIREELEIEDEGDLLNILRRMGF